MKKTAILAAAVLVGMVIAKAQSPAPAVTWSAPVSSTAQCGTSPSPTYPAAICFTTTGPQYTIDGGTTWHSLIGPVGPAGPSGPTGAVGPQGPPGPVQAFSANSCTGWNIDYAAGVPLFKQTGCTQTP